MSTYNDAILIMYPSGVKSGKIFSLKPTDGSGDLNFTRASTGTRVNPIGLIESVAANVPRIDYTDGGCGKLLLEPQRTNLITQSTETAAMFTIGAAAVTSNVAIAPDGTLTADRISGVVSALYGQFNVAPSTTYTFSFYCKNNGGTDAKYQIFDVTNGSDIIGVTSYFADINDITYSKVTITFTTPVGCTAIRVFIARSETAADRFVWGYQLEAGNDDTSTIPTAGSAVTRLADIASVTTPLGVTEITETFGDGSTNIITSIPVTYTASLGQIQNVIMI